MGVGEINFVTSSDLQEIACFDILDAFRGAISDQSTLFKHRYQVLHHHTCGVNVRREV